MQPSALDGPRENRPARVLLAPRGPASEEIARALASCGHDVEHADTAREVLERAPRADVLILEPRPELRPRELCPRIRRAGVRILLTPTSRPAGGALPADAVLYQPFEPEELVTAVDRLVELNRIEHALLERTHDLLAAAAHDLRNPLATLQAALPVLEHAPPGGDLDRRTRAAVARQVDRLARLIELLDAPRIPTEGSVSLAELLVRVAPPSVPVAVPDEPLFVTGSEEPLARVFTYLLGVGRSSDDVTVEIEPPDDGGFARIVIRRPSGPARGLALLRFLVERSGGALGCHEDGTHLLVDLPLAEEVSPRRRRRRPTARAG